MKTCTKCGETKPMDEFHNTSRSEGKKPYCKRCAQIAGRKRYEEKKHHINKVNAVYIKNHPEIRKRKQEKYRKAHPERIAAKRKRRYAREPDKFREASKRTFYRMRDTISDGYCSHCLRSRLFKKEQITPDLISAERVLIKIKRAVMEIEG